MKPDPTLIVVALGGNALVRPGERGEIGEQRRQVDAAVRYLPRLLHGERRLLLTHGNGPVIGQMLLRNEAAAGSVPQMPLDVCDAESEGNIGYLVQQALANILLQKGEVRPVVSLITRVEVDACDPAFRTPDKPVGPFYDRMMAQRLAEEHGWALREDAGRGYRRVVPSPQPLRVLEEPAIRLLLEHSMVVVAAGGGGIPVVRDAQGYRGVEAVIDKDRVAALLAASLGARRLIILTAEEYVYRSFGRPEQEPLRNLDASEAALLLQAGEFPAGSMGPKIEAAIAFLEGGGEEVVITLPEALPAALQGESGTRILSGRSAKSRLDPV